MKLFDLLPRRCLCCGEPGPDAVLCRSCQARYQGASPPESDLGRCPVCAQIRLAEAGPCIDCQTQSWSFPVVEGLFGYQETGGELLRLYKFGGMTGLARFWAGPASGRLFPPGPLVPVPPHPGHRRHRGWDPVDLFVRRLGERCGLPVWPLLVRRPSATQKSLGRQERMVNAKSSYALAPGARSRLAGVPAVWLVDDVVTTGATVEACSRLLLGAGVGEVRVFCLGLH